MEGRGGDEGVSSPLTVAVLSKARLTKLGQGGLSDLFRKISGSGLQNRRITRDLDEIDRDWRTDWLELG